MLRPCLEPLCDQLVSHGRCAQHTKAADRRIVRRGREVYATAKWRRRRKAFLTEHPWCSVVGCPLMATDVNHRIEIGTEVNGVLVDPWDESLWEGLCHAHHSSVTAKHIWHRN